MKELVMSLLFKSKLLILLCSIFTASKHWLVLDP